MSQQNNQNQLATVQTLVIDIPDLGAFKKAFSVQHNIQPLFVNNPLKLHSKDNKQ